MITCPLCRNSNAELIFSKKLSYDNEYTNPHKLKTNYSHFKCIDCNFIFLPKPQSLDIESHYDEVWIKSCNYEEQSDQLIELFTKRINQLKLNSGSKILDIGCALGYSLKAFSNCGFHAYGQDVSNYLIDVAKKQTDYDVIKQTIEEKTSWSDEFFDVVTMSDVTEHLENPTFSFDEIRRILKPNGILSIHTLNYDGLGRHVDGSNWPLIMPPGHMSYFSAKTLKKFLSSHGFKILYSNTYGIATNQNFLRRTISIMMRRLPKFNRIYEKLELGDYLEIIAKKI